MRTHLDPGPAIEQERALIGSLLSERDAVLEVAHWLRPGAFASGLCRALYEAILVCWRDRVPPDPITVDHGLRATNAPPEFRNLADRIQLMAEVPEPFNALHYARNVAAYARQRAVVEMANDLMLRAAADPSFDPDALYRARMAEIAADDPDDGDGPVPYADLVPGFRDDLLEGWKGARPRTELPTGFSRLDRALRGGLRRGEFTILAARPGAGKTAMLLQMSHNFARRNRGRVVIFSAEMTTESLLWRAVAEVSGIPAENVETGKIPDHLKDAVLYATERMETMPVAIDDTSRITVAQMLRRTQRVQRREVVAAVLFDYIELAGDKAPGRGDSEELRLSTISHGLKHLARSCHVPVVALAQLNREVERRKDKIPQLSDLRWSGALEQDADQVIFLFRHDYYVSLGMLDPDPAKEGICDLILAKQRNGPTGTFPVRFLPEITAFSDLEDERRGVVIA